MRTNSITSILLYAIVNAWSLMSHALLRFLISASNLLLKFLNTKIGGKIGNLILWAFVISPIVMVACIIVALAVSAWALAMFWLMGQILGAIFGLFGASLY